MYISDFPQHTDAEMSNWANWVNGVHDDNDDDDDSGGVGNFLSTQFLSFLYFPKNTRNLSFL